MSALTVKDVTKSFGAQPVLRGVDLEVASGALAAVLGPSGCGKTTLLRVVAGFEQPDSGSVTVGGRQVTGPGRAVAPERRRVAVVPQEGALFPHLTVAENVAFGLPRRARRGARVGELLELVGLAGYGDRMPSQLSGGQQQRVAVARALAPAPDVVLLDEPFSALDAALRAAVRADVRAALHAAGATAVLVTHDQEEALSTADVVAVMRDGVVVQSGLPQDVYRYPKDVDVARFVGEAVVIPATVRDGVVWTPLGHLPLTQTAADGMGTVVLRPEQVHLVDPADGLPARVVDTYFYGHDASVRLEVHCPGEVRLPVVCRTQGELPEEQAVGVRIVGPVTWFPEGTAAA
ncbi:ABC transporter ATP-binding protein [Cellulomonas bogoriensis]|uniref:ABC-type quaternary amine transporter n=1 Tax=Cellulomonas bogoriensis 69B4 = DSM 16987 TaxID=1386082 RepID=A0A0A0BY45_9CELL|nr:ABC transporter ATP-binding protein [Cellulomonas bogoriensis]KGM12831.1 ABC transporter [Cellulomonas bogoriensis 69B4 = DSM 16987]